MDDRKDVTVPMPAELVEEIDQQLEYGDSRAGWIREAIKQRLKRDQRDQGNPNSARAD